MKKLIGICGYARSGKDTAAQALIALGCERQAFADALKHDAWLALNDSWEEVYPNNGIDPNLFQDPASKEIFRPFLVEYGRAMRNLAPRYWIDRAMTLVRPYLEVGIVVVITDVRYRNEVDAIRALGGVVIGITRPGLGPANAEEAESFKDLKPDFVVCNNGTIPELHGKMMEVLKGIEDAE